MYPYRQTGEARVGLGMILWLGKGGVGRVCSAHSCLRLPVQVAVWGCVAVKLVFTAARSRPQHYSTMSKSHKEESVRRN